MRVLRLMAQEQVELWGLVWGVQGSGIWGFKASGVDVRRALSESRTSPRRPQILHAQTGFRV